ncbi:MAG TPA: hypothetical protein VFS16_02820 [Acidimicrobiia bacterium]|nr:hypothetical protein [Acidimicrobiia bacterium]
MKLRRPSTVLAAALCTAGLLLPVAPASAESVGGKHVVVAFFMDYFPSSKVTIKQGESIVLGDLDPTAGPGHTFTEDTGLEGPQPRFDSGVVPPGTAKEVPNVSSLAPGTYKVRCSIHIVVRGTLTVG